MKRLLTCLLAFSLLLSLFACAKPEDHQCSFYYLRSEETIRYGEMDALIAPISREIADVDADLEYLLQMYLDNPAQEGYVSPIPKGTFLLSTLWREDVLVIVLSREFSSLDHISLTLAGACLAATCRDLTGAERIEVQSGDQIYEFNLNNYTFLDGSTGQ